MERFINPYTFVPTEKGEKRNISEYYEHEDRLLSGKIHCTMKTRTQITICDKVSEQQFDFFNVDGKPVIPGSSIRGVIRGVYETLTNSCFSSTNAEDDDYFSTRLNKSECGLLCFRNGEFILYRAKRYKDKNNSQLGIYSEGEKVSFDSYEGNGKKKIFYLEKVNDSTSPKTGYVHKVNRFHGATTNLDSIFEQIDFKGTKIDKKYIDRFQVNLSMSQKTSGTYQKLFEKMIKGNAMLPVWYCRLNGHYYFASSQMSRSVFSKKPIDILKEHNLQKCTDMKNVCDACALFGMVSGNDACISSRLRFSDAQCMTANPLEPESVTVILGSPRLSSFEFYLRCNARSFTVDQDGVNIAGRKYYWHNNSGKPLRSVADSNDNNNMKHQIRLMKKDSMFGFDVFFDNITEEQLKKLVFALNLGENDLTSDHCHKIGHGKPLGLGSVKIICDKITVRRFEYPRYIEEDYSHILNEDNAGSFADQQNVKYILRVTDFNAVNGKDISYPYTFKGKKEIFKWFAGNRDGMRFIGKPIIYKQKLPGLMETYQKLDCESPKVDKQNNR